MLCWGLEGLTKQLIGIARDREMFKTLLLFWTNLLLWAQMIDLPSFVKVAIERGATTHACGDPLPNSQVARAVTQEMDFPPA